MIGATIGQIFKVFFKSGRLLGLLLLLAPFSFTDLPLTVFRSLSAPTSSGGGQSPSPNRSGKTAAAQPDCREILSDLLAKSAAGSSEAGEILRRLNAIGSSVDAAAGDRKARPADRKARDIDMALAMPCLSTSAW